MHLLQRRSHFKTHILWLALWLTVSWLAAAALGASATPNRALKLDGKGSYVELPPDIFKELTQATVEVWARWSAFNSFSRVLEFGAGYHSVSLFNHVTNSDLRFNIYPRMAKNDPAAMHVVTARNLLRTNEWIHIAAVSGPGGMKLYANGRLVGQHTNTTTFADIKVTHTNLIGRGLARNVTDRDFSGQIDEVRVWNHRRTLEQIREHMFKRLAGNEPGLMALWSFDDGSARDLTPNGFDGKLVGKARISNTDLDLAAPLPAAPAVASSTTSSPPATLAALSGAVPPGPTDASRAVWWIAGALFALVAILAWLALMLRRSGLGSQKLAASAPALTGGAAAAGLPPAEQREIKDRALAELTDFAKESLVQGLYSQRAALFETHQQAQQELAELEARIVALHLPERIQVYEKRIAELEARLENRNDELHSLTQATLELLRQRLSEEREKQQRGGRLN